MFTPVETCNTQKKKKQQQKEHQVLTNAICTDNTELNLTSRERDSVAKNSQT